MPSTALAEESQTGGRHSESACYFCRHVKEKKRTRHSDVTSPLLKHQLHIAHAKHDDAAGVTIHAAGFGAFSTGG